MKRIIITIGDPAGCGPFITLEAIDKLQEKKLEFFVIGDKKVLEKYPIYRKISSRFNLIDLNSYNIEKLKKGCPSKLGGLLSLNYLKTALEFSKKNNIKRIVTAPISKEAVGLVLKNFKGHTEYLAKYFGVKNIAMMMYSKRIKVVLFSRHIVLRDVPFCIKERDVFETINLVFSALKNLFKIKNPKIAISSLNPHAGLNTFMEREEKIIYSAIRKFLPFVSGPFPADTLFVEGNLKKYHCIIALYHDQGMIPFKLLSFREGVNLTLGLPIIRTSPSHGVAYDIIKKNKKPFSSSMVEAIKLSAKLSI